ncbi:MAG TPA: hypothetical protein VGI82_06105, partial [Chitinophagaceae bacterium]
EKLKFTFRFIVLLAALPVIMFTELTRKEKVNINPKQDASEKVSDAKSNEITVDHFAFLQAVYN